MRREVTAVALLVLVLSIALAAQNAGELYQRGLVQEHANGNLQDAIALYAKAVETSGRDRTLAAGALVRIAACHEKLGQRTEASSAYGEIVRVYPEQRAEVALAQERLTVLRPAPSARETGAGVSDLRDVSSVTAPFFARYCTSCHDGRSASGRVALGSLEARDVGRNTATWETIVRRLQARHDPPAGAPRPDDRSYRVVVSRIEQALDAAYAASGAASVERVSDVNLASRMAMLLWNEAPDAPLLDAARRGDLRDAAGLEREVRRMLRDEKSRALVDGFFASWLALDRLSRAQPDSSVFPHADAELLQAMSIETRLFLASQLRDDRDAVELWTADYTFVNERLARHYGLPNVSGPQFRRVAWADTRRAGILGQGGLLTALSFATRTSPTVRGSYVLSRFLGIDAPAPPANVPALDATPAPEEAGMRARMNAHKVNPGCASCHGMFDPLGFALENFDATGAWRTSDGGRPIDASGSFTDGTRFDGPAGLRAGLLKYRPAYYTAVTRQLLAYALNRRGNGGSVYDYEMAAVRRIVRDSASSGYRWSALLAGISASAPFQMKRLVP